MANHIYHLQFREPPIEGDARYDFFFSSIAAIFEVFTPKQTGVSLRSLWESKIDFDRPFYGKLCFVRKERLHNKPHKQNN